MQGISHLVHEPLEVPILRVAHDLGQLAGVPPLMASLVSLRYCLEGRFHFFCFHLLQYLGYGIGGIGLEELLEVGDRDIVGHGGVAKHGIERMHLQDTETCVKGLRCQWIFSLYLLAGTTDALLAK